VSSSSDLRQNNQWQNSQRSDGPSQVAVVLSGWPRVSEVFALNEVLALKRAGMLAAVFATKRQQDGLCQPDASELDPLVTFLPDGDAAFQAVAAVQALKGVAVSGVHGYFAHQPAAVAADAAQRLGLPYSFSVHALDVRKVNPAELGRRARAAAAVICCNGDVAADVAATGQRPTLVPHGVDLHRFPPASAATPAPAAGSDVVTLLSVGRLVEKKGFTFLLDAVAMLAASQTRRPFRLRVVGEGPWRGRLEDIIAARGLGDTVELLGRRTHETLPALYAESDLVVVPSIIDSTGDRDGLPNVLLEAMASSRPVVASDVAAISSAVRHGTTGLLVPPGDARALATALGELIDDEQRRSQMGRSGRLLVEREFELGARTDEFCHTLERAYA
jgi:glycosyltransferase involved in cell wall biosynthesis